MVDITGIDLAFRPASYWEVRPLTDPEQQTLSALLLTPYLPAIEEDEVAIASIWLQSTTNDVIELRVRSDGEKLRYRVVDEYWDVDAFTYQLPTETSDLPLTLGELIELIDTVEWGDGLVGLVAGPREMTEDLDPEKRAEFVTVTSDVYPQLCEYYRREAEAWLSEQRRATIAEELDGEQQRFADGLVRRRDPRGPADFPAGQRVNPLSFADVEELERWARRQPGVEAFRIQRPAGVPRRHPMAPRKEWSFDLAWTIGGAVYHEHYAWVDNPTVDEAFRAFVKTVADLHSNAELPVNGEEHAEDPSSPDLPADALVRRANRIWAEGRSTLP